MYSNTLSLLLTVDDRNHLDDLLEEVQRQMYRQGGQKLEDVLQQMPVPADVYRAMLADYREAGQDSAAFVDGLSQAAKAMTPVKMTLARQPSQSFLTELAAWLEREVGPNYILDLQIDPTVVGGVVLEHQGKYADYSLRTRLDEVLKTAKMPEKVGGGAA